MNDRTIEPEICTQEPLDELFDLSPYDLKTPFGELPRVSPSLHQTIYVVTSTGSSSQPISTISPKKKT